MASLSGPPCLRAVAFAGLFVFIGCDRDPTLEERSIERFSVYVAESALCPDGFGRLGVTVDLADDDRYQPGARLALDGPDAVGLGWEDVTVEVDRGSFDGRGRVRMTNDPRQTWERPLRVRASLRARAEFASEAEVPARYDCDFDALHLGAPGRGGARGERGENGRAGADRDNGPGGDGQDGRNGQNGQSGRRGGDAPAVDVHLRPLPADAELIEVVTEDANGRWQLFYVDRTEGSLVVHARGGRGGAGGDGGDGGTGGTAGRGEPPGRAGDGGSGGDGADGGDGGAGGQLTVLLYPGDGISEFAVDRLRLVPAGGAGGRAGRAGSAGSGGSGQGSRPGEPGRFGRTGAEGRSGPTPEVSEGAHWPR